MPEAREPLEIFWDTILSRQPEQIRGAFILLDDRSRQKLIAHLKRMVSEEGWHPEQRKSAQIALDTLTSEEQS